MPYFVKEGHCLTFAGETHPEHTEVGVKAGKVKIDGERIEELHQRGVLYRADVSRKVAAEREAAELAKVAEKREAPDTNANKRK